MATEVACGQCHGRLLVEQLGVVVACPHCGVHLSIPAPPTESSTHDAPEQPNAASIEMMSPPEPSPSDAASIVPASVGLQSAPSNASNSVESPVQPESSEQASPLDFLNQIRAAAHSDIFKDRDTDAAATTLQGASLSGQVAQEPVEMSFNFGVGTNPFAPSESPSEKGDDSDATSIFEDDHEHEEPSHDGQPMGWHSAPNLFLTENEDANASSVSEGDAGGSGTGKLFTSPLMYSGPSGIFNPADLAGMGSGSQDTSEKSASAGDGESSSSENAAAIESVADDVAGGAGLSGSAEASLDISPVSTTEAAPMMVDDHHLHASAVFVFDPTPAATEYLSESASDVANAITDTTSNDESYLANIVQPGSEPVTASLSDGAVNFQDLTAAVATTAATTIASASATEAATSSTSPAVGTGVGTASPALTDEQAAMRLKLVVGLLFLSVSYASAVTLAIIYLIFFGGGGGGGPHALESLPDVKPKVVKSKAVSSYYSPKNDVAPGHVLELGKSERFGSVRVTPVKVTRGILKFEHFSGPGSAFVQSPTTPLLKLWLKFENVSKDQEFAPLDPILVYKREMRNQGANILANNFLGTDESRKLGKSLMYVYDMPVESEFKVIGQKLDVDIGPGKTWETFIPSEEKAANANGDLIWRVHFRKGYNPTSLRGVTTLIDVKFNASEIKDESA